jgi:hypothetical protein
MPKLKTSEKDRLKKAHFKKKTRLKLDVPEGFRAPTKMEMVRPRSPEEAKEFLRAVADHLSNVPYGSPRFRFVAYGLKRFLTGKETLSRALGLSQQTKPVLGRPSVSSEQVSAVTEMLVRKVPVKQIARETRLSKSTIDRIRADYNAVTWESARRKVDVGEMIPDIEADEAEDRERKVSKHRRAAIIEGMARAIPLKDILPDQ